MSGWTVLLHLLLDLLRIVVTLLPAMTANTFAPFLGGGPPVDMGLTRRDGRRFLGDGKTWRGLLGGSICASILGFVLLILLHFLGLSSMENGLWGKFPVSLLIIPSLAFGSLFGDMLGSFVKRALGRPRGAKTPLLDQWDYVIGAFIFILPFYPWWYDSFISGGSWIALLLFLFVAWAAHQVANRIGYAIGVKKEPW